MRKIVVLSVVFFAFPLWLSAQDSTRVTTLQEVVVSATRTEQPVIEAPRSVTVIGGETIRNSVYQSVGELLNAYSGLFVVGATQTPGTNQNIFLRGTNSNQVAVLIDGVRVTDPSSPNAAIDFSEISLVNVERIEILRGSHSTLFGGAAVGGVINIITKSGARTGIHGDVSWQGGSFGKKAWSSTESVDLSYGAPTGWYLRGSVYRQDARGLDSSEEPAGASSFTSDRDNFRKTDATIKAGFRNEKWNVSASLRKAYQYTEIDDGAFTDDENSYLEFDRMLYQYGGTYKIDPSLELSLVGSFSNSERFFEDDSSRVAADAFDHTFTSGTYYGRLQTHELQLTYNRSAFRAVVGTGLYGEKMFFDSYVFFDDGSGFPYESVTNYDSLDTRTTTGYLFGRAGYKSGNFDLAAGARISRHTEAGVFTTFELNPSYSFNHFLVFASLSSGFNPPSLYQLYDATKNFGAFATRGNPDLSPEQSLSIEVGVKKQFVSGSYVTVSGYRTEVDNSIEYVYLWNKDTPVTALNFADDRGDRYINVSQQKVIGLEVEGLVQFTNAVSLMGNFSALRAAVRATPGDLAQGQTGGHHVQLYNLGRFIEEGFEQSEVVRRPTRTAFARLMWEPGKRVDLYAAYRYTADRFDAAYDFTLGPYGALARTSVNSFHLADVGINWRATEVLSLRAKVENVLDEAYHEVTGFRTRGRSFYLKMLARF